MKSNERLRQNTWKILTQFFSPDKNVFTFFHYSPHMQVTLKEAFSTMNFKDPLYNLICFNLHSLDTLKFLSCLVISQNQQDKLTLLQQSVVQDAKSALMLSVYMQVYILITFPHSSIVQILECIKL
ncbi:CLUMA_CG000915, isoform A [Clunio marinus]|uniref:CLUMA_CG000915, isoform A n=1 Tax=Clunio marinus TaxID=568069 RepID=A0A1J1HKP7_9DIPT|nr:CLUMA_CG000915, isoform A [Clunio marinus]